MNSSLFSRMISASSSVSERDKCTQIGVFVVQDGESAWHVGENLGARS